MKKKTMCSVPGCGNENTGEMMIYRMDIDKKLFLPLCTFCHDAMLNCFSTIGNAKENVNSVLHAADGMYIVTINGDESHYQAEKSAGVWYFNDGKDKWLLEYPQSIVSIKKIDGPSAPLSDHVRRTYSRADIVARANEFMEQRYGESNKAEFPDEWFQRYGFLIHFIHEHFPEK